MKSYDISRHPRCNNAEFTSANWPKIDLSVDRSKIARPAYNDSRAIMMTFKMV